MNDTDTLADDLRKDSLALMKLLADEKRKSEALEAELAAEKMQHSVTIADEHESRSEFQDRIRALEARNATLTAEVMHYTAGTPHPLAAELAAMAEKAGGYSNQADRFVMQVRSLEVDLIKTKQERNDELRLRQTAEGYAARNALRVIEVEAALQLIGNELSLQADKGPAGEAFRALLKPTLPETKSAPGFCPECLMTGGHKLHCSKAEPLVDLKNPHNAHHPDRLKGPGLTAKETACESRCAFDTNNGDRCILPDGHEGNHSL